MVDSNSNDDLAPLTFKMPSKMLEMIEEIIKSGEYETRAELIRDAIQKLIDWELKIPSVK